MRVCLINTSDISGGAAIAAYRLHQGLQLVGLDSQMLVQDKVSDDYTVLGATNKLGKGWAKLVPTIDSLPKILYPQRENTHFAVQWFPNNTHHKINQLKPDIVNLHWICGGFVPIKSLSKINAPLVWSLHDMWAFTGGCHYAGDCQSYQNNCGTCPQLGSNRNQDLSLQIWRKKQRHWQNLNITIVALSNWLADSVKKSSLFANNRIEVIPNSLDTNVYKPINKQLARTILNLPQDKKLILFGAMNATSDQRKGFQFLCPALEQLASQINHCELVIFGASKPFHGDNFPFQTNYLGRLADDISLAIIYSAVDVFVAPSLEDNLPNTVMEALACGTPSVAFNIGGMPDMITHQENGYLANPFSVADLTYGINWVLENNHRWQKLSANARDMVLNKFTLQHQATKYLELYQDLLSHQ
jgi:glycosyltransferase involved in cell wall biosynthesis